MSAETSQMLRDRIDKLEAALQFYANHKNYDEYGIPRIPAPGCTCGRTHPDMGTTAKKALDA